MVNASNSFIIFEYFKKLRALFPQIQIQHLENFLIMLMISCFIIFLFCPKPEDGAKINKRKIFFHLFLWNLIGLITLVVSENVKPILTWQSNTLGFSNLTFLSIIIYSLIGGFAIVAFIIARFQDKEPNNASMLNKRQVWMTCFTLALVVLIFFTMWRFEYPLFKMVVLVILFTAEIISLLFWFYDPLIYILSRFVNKKTIPACEPTEGKENRFAVIGCAHNEEKVIGELIKSIQNNKYSKYNYDIYVICDNCSDSTADVVRKHGAIAMERHDPDKRGKGFGLEWMFDILQEKREHGTRYDAYIVLDADNVVNEEFMSEINDKLNEGHEILQCYLGCKNPGDTWISKCYSFAYWLSNSLYQEAHANLGLSAQMGGTGMVIRPSVLDEIGWETDSLTEDLILTTRYVLKKNRPCHWVHHARLYDEKPLKLIPSMKQRTRWMQGHMDAMTKYAFRALYCGLTRSSLKDIDIAFYLMRPFFNLVMFACYVLRWVGVLFFPDSFISETFLMNFNTAIALTLAYSLIHLYIIAEEKYLRYFYWLPLQWVFTYSWYLPFLRGFIKQKERYWVSTIHERAMGLEDIAEDIIMVEAKKRLQGIDNLADLPIGQLLCRASIISEEELQIALDKQKEEGGFLGEIMVKTGITSNKILNTYLTLQQLEREQSTEPSKEEQP